MVFLFILYVIILYASFRIYQRLVPKPNIDPKGKYVLISGCDTGFGNGLALELDKQGFSVLAGVFVKDNISVLQSKLSNKATVFHLDITNQESIDEAFNLVQTKTKVLHALVNNAGIGLANVIDLMTMDELRKVMEVNFFGHVAMTKKFLSLLIVKSDSRVVNICSVAGYLASPSMASYCASKFALESFSDCLRREMVPWNLRVSIIEPGFMRTPIIQGVKKSFDEIWATLPVDARERWGEEYMRKRASAGAKNKFIQLAEDPIKVVRALQHAVMNTAPEIRYRPGFQSSLFFFPLSMLPAEFVDWILARLSKSTTLPASVAKQISD